MELNIRPKILKTTNFRKCTKKQQYLTKNKATLPWKADHPPQPTNKYVAFRRTESVIKRLRKEPKLLFKYGEIVDEQGKRGFIKRVDNEEIKPNMKLHYIPHQPVK